ncbi:hypothetical protein [Micromonospora costi]|uniref:Flavin reductase n=1 Tax=Micromonospora costi TaxID=1530042 RepID=A0A3B0A5V1_9ACTN|nr:hypothetical protein [Micromonospora costi]RKN55811.1 hypothetical protein D7193_14505 [Micromonospora costi]
MRRCPEAPDAATSAIRRGHAAAPWPCAPARLALAREYAGSRVALCLYLSSMLHDAATDLHLLDPHGAPGPRQLFDRFVGWAAHPRPAVD